MTAGVKALTVCMNVTGIQRRLMLPRHTLRLVTTAIGRTLVTKSILDTVARGLRPNIWNSYSASKEYTFKRESTLQDLEQKKQ